MRDLLGQHLLLTKTEAIARLQQDWARDVAAFDEILAEILTIADALTDGGMGRLGFDCTGVIPPQRPDRPASTVKGGSGTEARLRRRGRPRATTKLT